MSQDPELYRKLVEVSADGLWLLDEQGSTILYNPRMGELLGRTPEQMEGLSAFDVHDDEGKKEFAQHLAAARAGHPGHFDREDVRARRERKISVAAAKGGVTPPVLTVCGGDDPRRCAAAPGTPR